MTNQQLLFVFIELSAFCLLFKLVASKKLLEKYIVLWLIALITSLVSYSLVFLAPSSVSFFGFKVGSNLLIFGWLLILSALTLQLSVEMSRQEKRTEILATQIALLNSKIQNNDSRS